MDVNEPLVRGHYRFATGVERPEVVQDNDIDTPFETDKPVGIPPDLMALIHQAPSVDPDPEKLDPIEPELDADKVNEENPQSRFTVINVPIHKPGYCVICKSPGGEGRQFVDTKIQITWVGAIYFCTFCIMELAKLIGIDARSSDWDLAHKNLQEAISEGDDRWVESQRKLDAAMVLLGDHLAGNCCTLAHAMETSEGDAEASDSNPGDSVPESESSDGDESDADESDSIEGPNDVPADSDDKPKRRPPIRNKRPGTPAK